MTAQKPHSRKPESWERPIIDTLLAATKGEVFIPFETDERVAQFKSVIRAVRRSYKEHEHPDWDTIANLTMKEMPTVQAMDIAEKYQTDPVRYPYTLVIGMTPGFTQNLQAATPVAANRPNLRKEETHPIDDEPSSFDYHEIFSVYKQGK